MCTKENERHFFYLNLKYSSVHSVGFFAFLLAAFQSLGDFFVVLLFLFWSCRAENTVCIYHSTNIQINSIVCSSLHYSLWAVFLAIILQKYYAFLTFLDTWTVPLTFVPNSEQVTLTIVLNQKYTKWSNIPVLFLLHVFPQPKNGNSHNVLVPSCVLGVILFSSDLKMLMSKHSDFMGQEEAMCCRNLSWVAILIPHPYLPPGT